VSPALETLPETVVFKAAISTPSTVPDKVISPSISILFSNSVDLLVGRAFDSHASAWNKGSLVQYMSK